MPEMGTMHQLNPEPMHIGTMHQLNPEPLHMGTILTPQSQAEQYAREAKEAATEAAQSATDAQTAAESAEQAVAGAVKYSEAQTLTAAQQAQARANIGAADTVALAAKQDAPAIAGTEGQVLTIDDQGDPVWATPTDAVSRQEFDALAEDVDWKAPAIIASAGPADIVSITDGAEDAPVKSLVVNIEPVQAGSGDPSPDNVRPITGRDSVQVLDDPVRGGNIEWNQGANLNIERQGVSSNITYDLTGNGHVKLTGQANDIANIPLGTACEIKEGHKYYSRLGDYVSKSDGDAFQINGWAFVMQFGRIYTAYKNMRAGLPLSFRSDDRSRVYDGSELAVQIFDLTQMFGAGNEPATVEEFRSLFPADYYPYNEGEITTVSAVNGSPYRHYSITFPTEAGTVYGGTLDVTNGVLVVDRAEIDLGTLTWNRVSGGFYCDEISDALPGTASLRYDHIQCSSYKAVNVASVAGLQNGECSIDGGKHIQIKDIRYTDAASFKTAMSGVQLVYELAEPITYNLTQQEVRTLLGQNSIWADTGTVSVEYTADTKMYIDSQTRATRSLIAGIETTMTASRPYAAGDLLIVGDTLYKAAASIASGATLTPGTNVTPTTVAEQLILLANA